MELVFMKACTLSHVCSPVGWAEGTKHSTEGGGTAGTPPAIGARRRVRAAARLRTAILLSRGHHPTRAGVAVFIDSDTCVKSGQIAGVGITATAFLPRYALYYVP